MIYRSILKVKLLNFFKYSYSHGSYKVQAEVGQTSDYNIYYTVCWLKGVLHKIKPNPFDIK